MKRVIFVVEDVDRESVTRVHGSRGTERALTSSRLGHQVSERASADTPVMTRRGARPLAVAVSATFVADPIPAWADQVVKRHRPTSGQRRTPPTGAVIVIAADKRKADDVAVAASSFLQAAVAKEDVLSRTALTVHAGSDVSPYTDEPTAQENPVIEGASPAADVGG